MERRQRPAGVSAVSAKPSVTVRTTTYCASAPAAMPASAAAPSTSRNSATTPTMIDRRFTPTTRSEAASRRRAGQLDGEVGGEAGEREQDHQHGDHDVEAQGEGEGVLVEQRLGGRLGLVGWARPRAASWSSTGFGVSARAQM